MNFTPNYFKPTQPLLSRTPYASDTLGESITNGAQSTKTPATSVGFFSANAGAMIGAGASLLGTATQIGLGINSLRQNKEALAQAREALTFQKEQYQDKKKNYDGFMQQTQASANAYNLKRAPSENEATFENEVSLENTQKPTMPMDKI